MCDGGLSFLRRVSCGAWVRSGSDRRDPRRASRRVRALSKRPNRSGSADRRISKRRQLERLKSQRPSARCQQRSALKATRHPRSRPRRPLVRSGSQPSPLSSGLGQYVHLGRSAAPQDPQGSRARQCPPPVYLLARSRPFGRQGARGLQVSGLQDRGVECRAARWPQYHHLPEQPTARPEVQPACTPPPRARAQLYWRARH